MNGLDLTALTANIRQCGINIQSYEDAIKKELVTKVEYQKIVDDPNSKFDLNSMKIAVGQCDVNVKTFEGAIEKELNTKREYQQIIRTLKAKEQELLKAEEATQAVKIIHIDDED